MVRLFQKDLLDEQTHIHFAFHQSLNEITFPHTHDFHEVFLITKGRLRHHVNGAKQILNQGALVFIRAHDQHYFERNNNDPCHLYNLAFKEEFFSDVTHFLGRTFNITNLINAKLPALIMLAHPDLIYLTRKFESLQTIINRNKKRVFRQARLLLLELFIDYFDNISDSTKQPLPHWLANLMVEMQKKDNFYNGTRRMAELTNYSREHIARIFKKYYGIKPTQYINELRLNHAANMLLTTDYSITYVAMDVGYNNISHFNHLFKQQFKQSPRKFRTQRARPIIP